MVQSQTKPESNRTKSAFFPPLRGTPMLTAASSGVVAAGGNKANAGASSVSERGRSLEVTPPRSAKRRSKSSTASVAVFGFELSGIFTEEACFVSSIGLRFDIIILD